MKYCPSQKLRKAWATTSYSDICKLQINYVHYIGRSLIPIRVDPKTNLIICSNPNPNPKVPLLLPFTAILIILTYLCKFSLFAWQLSSPEMDKVSRGILLSKLGAYLITCGTVMKTNRFLLQGGREKARQVSGFLNCFNSFRKLGLGEVNTPVFKFLALQSPLVAVGSSLLGAMIMVQDVLAWGKLLDGNDKAKPLVYLGMTVMTVFEAWEIFVMYGMGCLLGYFAVYIPFGAIWNGTKSILSLCKNSGRPRAALERSFILYRRLQLFTGLANDCVGRDYSLWLMTLIMTWTILATPLVATPGIRDLMPLKEFCMIFGLLAELYGLCFFGYSFPGQANEGSKAVKKQWRRMLVVEGGGGGKTGRIARRVMRSFQDIRIQFGSMNYFEKRTNLVVVKFEVEQSASLMLLIK